jgi:hypothetical protein
LLVELHILLRSLNRTEGSRTMAVLESRRAFLKGAQVTLKFDITMFLNKGGVNLSHCSLSITNLPSSTRFHKHPLSQDSQDVRLPSSLLPKSGTRRTWTASSYRPCSLLVLKIGLRDPARDPLLLRNFGSAENRTRTPGFVARISDH